MDVDSRSGGLPPINLSSSDKPDGHARFSIAQLTNSHSATPAGHPSSPRRSPAPTQKPSLFLQTESSRQSLPPLKEALSSARPLPYNDSPPYAPAAHSPPPSHSRYPSQQMHSPPRLSRNGSGSAPSPHMHEPYSNHSRQYSHGTPASAPIVYTSYSSGIATTRPSPPQSRQERASAPGISSAPIQPSFAPWNPHSRSSQYAEHSHRQVGPPGPQPSYGSHSSFAPAAAHTNTSAYGSAPNYATASSQWRRADDRDYKEPRVPEPSPRPAEYGESVKRHLETFDFEKSLHEIAESTRNIWAFCDHYGQQAYRFSKSGLSIEAMPQLQEIDEIMKHASHAQENLACLRSIIQSQQAEMLERSRESINKAKEQTREDGNSDMQQDEAKVMNYSGIDAKKRRGRAAPPGRCHSCNREETPEWRRGPDGARTLCNACGLHYAKLTRKLGAKKANLSSSNLRPKSTASASSS